MRKPTSRTIFLGTVVAAAIVASAAYFWPSRADGPIREVGSSQPAQAQPVVESDPPPPKVAARTLPKNVSEQAPNYRQQLAKSKDYWALVNDTFEAANQGNAEAQFIMYRALRFCKDAGDNYLKREGRVLSSDEIVQVASKSRISLPLMQALYDRCHVFVEKDASIFGDQWQWLQEASDAGLPVAQATLAVEMLNQQMMQGYLKAGAVLTPDATAPTIGDGQDPKTLIRDAVESKDPEVLFRVGEAQAMLYPGKNAITDYLAWTLVACQRGFDCSTSADWILTGCNQCDASTPVNLIRSRSGDRWPLVEQRARDIDSMLEAGQWDELGPSS